MKLAIPTCEEVRALRRAARLSQSKAAALVHLRSPRMWSAYERGERNIDAARFELFLIKADLHAGYCRRA
ncbi:helix-turn-helix domain-containing protein [Paraburkholderia sp. MM6662-R1]|uniref:helix-turn-helix domain-containing protein n=1 Tax=Paraburkholderia sp. MM6662-R1 TaxID=2991066 RepID=UPI003D1FB0AA